VNGPGLVDHLVEVLEQIDELLPDDKAGWDADVRTRLAIERLWITAGNVAEVHRTSVGLDVGTGPWAELSRDAEVGMRASMGTCRGSRRSSRPFWSRFRAEAS
jgi:hypothetical protein